MHDKARSLTRLKKIAGQVEGVGRMLEEDRYCIDVLIQLAAVRAGLGKVAEEILENHLHTCVVRAISSGDPSERERVVKELMDVLRRSSAVLR
jgi:CsoR family transcriptional regulator, copper-sensing transcriptional repressor